MESDAGESPVTPLQLARTSIARSWLGRHRGLTQALLDAGSWVLAVLITARWPLGAPGAEAPVSSAVLAAGVCASLAPAIGAAAGLYAARWQYGSFEEVKALAPTALLTALLALLVDATTPGETLPAGSLVAALTLSLVLMCGTRYLWRMWADRGLRPDGGRAERVVVFGAGQAGAQVVKSMLASPNSDYVPAALLDDDPHARRRRIRGVPVVGDRYDIATAARTVGARVLLIAVPSAASGLIREISDLAHAADLSVVVLPSVNELVRGRAETSDIRPLTPADLLGRAPIDTDVAAIAGYLTGHRVLVTGAGGSIGSELCRQIVGFNPSQLVMLDRDESALHGVQLSIEGSALLDSPNIVVADIRDRDRLADVFEEHAPEVVFHAAALKHLPLLEMHPGEALKTNVWGTLNVLEAASAAGVGTLINISTDKAADPTSVLGYSKRLAERLTAEAARTTGRAFLSVRFGNVVGSRGSVLLTFQAQIAAGGPVTVTDPDVSRFFMTVEEAVQLVVQAGALGGAGEVLVLDMGEPVNIADLAHRLIRTSCRRVEVVYTGLRAGEKLHEQLIAAGECAQPSKHPLMLRTTAAPLPFDEVRDLDPRSADIVSTLARTASAELLDAESSRWAS